MKWVGRHVASSWGVGRARKGEGELVLQSLPNHDSDHMSCLICR